MDRLGVGVIGLGVFGERHARIYASMPEVRLVAVCSRSADRGQEVAGRLGFLRYYTDMADILADPEVDAVSITTEPVRHAEMALTALQAGKHVLLEKPIATNLA
ncbi:MAG: Gfo/Idh/MocA family oxidoreductase, partial [Anaerolineae bacterium]